MMVGYLAPLKTAKYPDISSASSVTIHIKRRSGLDGADYRGIETNKGGSRIYAWCAGSLPSVTGLRRTLFDDIRFHRE